MRLFSRSRVTAVGAAAVLVVAALAAGCGDDSDPIVTPPTATRTVTATPSPTPTAARPSTILFSTEGERLHAYDIEDGFREQLVVFGGEDQHAGGISLNGQICFAPDGSRIFVAGDDAGQPAIPPGWRVMQLNGTQVGGFSVTSITKLTPTYQAERDNYGCAFLPDGRLLTTDIGNARSGPGTGQLIIWFPPFNDTHLRYCKLDIEIGTAGGIYVDAEENVYVASARGNPGVYRYRPPFPTADDAPGGCGQRDATGAPMVDGIVKETFIAPDSAARTPNAIFASRHGTFYVSSVLNGAIAEYDGNGTFLRRILSPPRGEVLGPKPYSTGTPFGLIVDSDDVLYYSDLGLVNSGGNIGPGRMAGTVRRIRFANGEPLPPETIATMFSFPDGLGLLAQ